MDHPAEEDLAGAKSAPPTTSAALGVVDPDTPPISQMIVEDAEASVDSAGAIRAGKLAGKSMWAAIWILSWPVLFQQLMTSCVGLADKVLAGNLSQHIVVPAMDAIGIGAYVGWLIGIAMAGLGIGGQALIARAMGAGNLHEGSRALGQAIGLSAIWGLLVGAVMWVTAGPLAEMCGLTDQAKVYCMQYVHMISYAMPFTGVLMVGSMCLHGAGETTLPSLISVGVNLVNIVFSWILSGVEIKWGDTVIGNPFPFELDVIGIAAGTALSSLFGAAMILWVLMRGVKDLKLETPHVRLDRMMSWRIVRLGVPNFLEGLAMWGVNLFVLIFIGQIAKRAIEQGGSSGEGLQGAHIIAVQWESLSFLPGFAMGTAAGALAGQYLGASNPHMAKKAVLACTLVGCIIMGLLGVLFMTSGELLTRIISSEPVHLNHVPNLLFICGTVQVFFALALAIRQGLRGAGDTLWPFIITSVSCYGVRLPLAWLLGVYLGWGIEGIWYALCGELVVRSLLFTARFLHGGWVRVRI